MNLYDSSLYMEDVRRVSELNLPWERLAGRTVLISGASGMIGSFLVDVLMERNQIGDKIRILALTRNAGETKQRFGKYVDSDYLQIISCDVKQPMDTDDVQKVDYVFHLASNTHPIQYATDPIGTITTNILGLQNMLDFAVKHEAMRFAFASSNEIYGENRGDAELFDEEYCGYIDSNTLRAGYPESKRCGEALCQAYRSQQGLDVVIPRFTRTYGPTMHMNDTKAVSQFIRNGVAGEDIILKSAGTQYYSYQYVADSVSGLLTILFRGKSGEAYNIAEKSSDITLKDLASLIAEINGKKVIFAIPDATEKAGYSKATKARLDGRKLMKLGWEPEYDIRRGIERTISILKDESLREIYKLNGR